MFKFVILVYFYFIYLTNNEVFGFSKLIVNNMIVNETKDELSRKPNEIYFVPKNSTSDSHSILITKLNFTKLESNPHDLFVIGENPNYFKYHITSNSDVKPKIPPTNSNEKDYKNKLEYLNLLFNCSVLGNSLKDKSVTKSKIIQSTALPKLKKKKNWEQKLKKPIKIVYESPAPLQFVENALNTIYNFFEDTFTTKVKIPTEKFKRQIKLKKRLRNNKINRRQGFSSTMAKKLPTTPSAQINNKITPKNNKQFMTTQIHVTSEYGGPTTATPASTPASFVEHSNKPIVIKKNDQSESSEDDYDFDFSFDNEEGSSESSSEEKRPLNYKNDEYDDEDETDDDYDDNDDSDSNSIFERVITSIKNFFSDNRTKKSSKYQYEEGKSTTPRIYYRKPKYPKISENSENSLQKTWYNPYIPSSHYDLSAEEEIDEINEITTIIPTTESGWFNNWFQEEDNIKINEITTTTSTITKNPGWFNGLFGNPFDYEDDVLTTTTANPLIQITDSYTNLTEWISFLKQKLKSTKTKNSDVSAPKRKYYNKYQMWRLYPTTIEHVSLLEDFRFSSEDYEIQWWKGPTLRGPTDILIPPHKIQSVKELLDYEEIGYETIIWDLQKALLYENPKMSKREKIEVELIQGHPLTWYRYHRYDDIIKFMEYLYRQYPKYVELIHIGQSYEGRHLIIAKISFKDEAEEYSKNHPLFMNKKKPFRKSGVFIEAGSHAREWITPAVATYIMDTLIKQITKNDTEGETLRSVDWYIIPTINPDGYEYSHQFDRMWKKSRSVHSNEMSNGILSSAFNWINAQYEKPVQKNCFGVDLNRNFDSSWEIKGNSKSPCSDIFMGPKPSSAPETRLLSKFLMENKKYIKLFLSLHSYGQMITYPTSANLSYNLQKVDDLLDMAMVASESLRGVGSSSRYIIDSSNQMLFPRSGSSDYFAFNKADIPYSYTIELRDTGTHGFILPPSYIEATAKDAFTIVKSMVNYL